MPGQADLAEVPTSDLVQEVKRRLECLTKPEKRLILIGRLHDHRLAPKVANLS